MEHEFQFIEDDKDQLHKDEMDNIKKYYTGNISN
jgi:hypothetical protein